MRWTPERVARFSALWATDAFWQDILAELNTLPGDPIPCKGQILRLKAVSLGLRRPPLGGALVKQFNGWRRENAASYAAVEAIMRTGWPDPTVSTRDLLAAVRDAQDGHGGRPAVAATKSGLHMLARSLGLGPRGGMKAPVFVVPPEDRAECAKMVRRGASDAELMDWFGWSRDTLDEVIASLPDQVIPLEDLQEAEALFASGKTPSYIMEWLGWDVETWALALTHFQPGTGATSQQFGKTQ